MAKPQQYIKLLTGYERRWFVSEMTTMIDKASALNNVITEIYGPGHEYSRLLVTVVPMLQRKGNKIAQKW